jgi:hypothetical protein
VDKSLCGSRLTLAIVGDRARSKCVGRGWSAGRIRYGLRELSVAVLEDSLSEPGASYNGVNPQSAPEYVSVSARKKRRLPGVTHA